jgi:hypothetical protein
MNKRQIIASLNNIANTLDNSGLYKEANTITKVMVKLAEDFDPGFDMGADDPELTRKFNEEKHTPRFGTLFDKEYLIVIHRTFEPVKIIPASELFPTQKIFSLSDLESKLNELGWYGDGGFHGEYNDNVNRENLKARDQFRPIIDREDKTITINVR